jgi:hypothetical protein
VTGEHMTVLALVVLMDILLAILLSKIISDVYNDVQAFGGDKEKKILFYGVFQTTFGFSVIPIFISFLLMDSIFGINTMGSTIFKMVFSFVNLGIIYPIITFFLMLYILRMRNKMSKIKFEDLKEVGWTLENAFIKLTESKFVGFQGFKIYTKRLGIFGKFISPILSIAYIPLAGVFLSCYIIRLFSGIVKGRLERYIAECQMKEAEFQQ